MSEGSLALPAEFLAGLSGDAAAELERVNGPGLKSLADYLESGRAIAFLGAGASVPLYPLWGELIAELVDRASDRLDEREAATCRRLAATNPDAVVEIVRRQLGDSNFREVLRDVFRVRRDPETGLAYTPTQQLVARCRFRGVVTTNYDPGIIEARAVARPKAAKTGFASWTNEDALDRWRTGDVFGDGELPVLFAHGLHNNPDSIVLASAEYRRAYRGKLGTVLGRLIDSEHLVWIGFSFTDGQIDAIIREVGQESGTGRAPAAARHVAILPWDPDPGGGGPLDVGMVRDVMEIGHGSQVVVYPTPAGDHGALALLLAALSAPPPPPPPPTLIESPVAAASEPVAVRWVHGGVPVDHFTGRKVELARLDRWARDREVRLIGVTAWGGAGKTALATEWLVRRDGTRARPVRGVFGWSFGEASSAEEWAEALLGWASSELRVAVQGGDSLTARIMLLVRAVPLLLVFDGLEVMQDGPASGDYGRLLNGVLRDTLTGLCRMDHGGLVVLTSRFPFADLEGFDGSQARMLDVPPFTPDEGAELLAAAGGAWLSHIERAELVRRVDGHALAVGVLAVALGESSHVTDVDALRDELGQLARTDERVAKVLSFYAERLGEADRRVVAIVSLFQRPVPVATVARLGQDEQLGAPLAGWNDRDIETAARQRLGGLVAWHPNATISAHPLVRASFRPLALSADAASLAAEITLGDLPDQPVASHDEAHRVVEMIELLLDTDQWEPANDLYKGRLENGKVFQNLPAARLGQRCASAFVGTEQRRRTCEARLSRRDLAFYLNEVGLSAQVAGDSTTAIRLLEAGLAIYRAGGDHAAVSSVLLNLSDAHGALGHAGEAVRWADEALTNTIAAERRNLQRNSLTCLANGLELGGDTVGADEQFVAADRIQYADDAGSGHLYSLRGVRWASFLRRTGRAGPSRRLTVRNLELSDEYGWNEDVARCRRLLGSFDLDVGDIDQAGHHLDAAVTTFRNGDMVTELTEVLADLAEQRRRAGQLDDAEQACDEAIDLAGPRNLVPAHAHALAVRASIRGDRFTTGGPDHLEQARDDADHALRLATQTRQLPWLELDATRAHAHLDQLEERDWGWQAKADQLHTRLVPAGLDPDPLATVEADFEPGR